PLSDAPGLKCSAIPSGWHPAGWHPGAGNPGGALLGWLLNNINPLPPFSVCADSKGVTDGEPVSTESKGFAGAGVRPISPKTRTSSVCADFKGLRLKVERRHVGTSRRC